MTIWVATMPQWEWLDFSPDDTNVLLINLDLSSFPHSWGTCVGYGLDMAVRLK